MGYSNTVPNGMVNIADTVYIKVMPGNSPYLIGVAASRRTLDPNNIFSETDLENRGFVLADGAAIAPEWTAYAAMRPAATNIPDLRRKDGNGDPLPVFAG